MKNMLGDRTWQEWGLNMGVRGGMGRREERIGRSLNNGLGQVTLAIEVSQWL